TVSGCRYDGIDVNGNGNEIRDNQVSKTRDNGIELDRATITSDCKVTGNTVTKTKYWGILLSGSRAVVTGNHVTSSGSDSYEVIGGDHAVANNTSDRSKYTGIYCNAPRCDIHDNAITSPKYDGI